MQLIRNNIKEKLEKAYNTYQKNYNLIARIIEYAVGDEVYRRNFVKSKKIGKFQSETSTKVF